MKGLVVAMCLAATPALADLPLVLEGCAPLYTIQKRGCKVLHLYRCETGDEPDWLSVSPQGDPPLAMLLDGEGNTVRGWNPDKEIYVGYAERPDPMSLAEARIVGQDTVDQTMMIHAPSYPEPLRVRQTGRVVSDDKIVTIDDVDFQKYSYELVATIGAVGIQDRGYFLRESRTGAVFAAEFTQEAFGVITSQALAPVQLIREGEAGFLDDNPVFDCNLGDAVPNRRPV